MNADNHTQYELEILDLGGVQTLVKWARDEGWNPGPYDAEIFYKTDPQGFVGYFNENELIAGGSIVSYNGDFGFMGFFIVKPEYRTNGLGRQLWYQRRDLLLSRLKPGALIGMDGVVAMQAFYKKGGFSLAFRDERYKLEGRPFHIHPFIHIISQDDFSAINTYDRQCFGFDRSDFLRLWLSMPEGAQYKYIQNNTLKGFVVMRKAWEGFKIGPLFADNVEVADALLQACLHAAVGHSVYLDIPENNTAGYELIRKYDGIYVFECARMYYPESPSRSTEKIFGITTFELG